MPNASATVNCRIRARFGKEDTVARSASGKHKWVLYIAYVWWVFKELFYLALVFSVFWVATTKFETVVIAILVLIYNSIAGFREASAMTFTETAAEMHQMYDELASHVGLSISGEKELKARRREEEFGIRLLITGISLFIGTAFAIGKIGIAILG
jgi:hypothetical protein